MGKYFRVMVGKGSKHFDTCRENNFIGVDYQIDVDLSTKLSDDWKEFNHRYIPLYLKQHPDKSKIAAGLAGGATHSICRGITTKDVILVPDGKGNYHICNPSGPYEFHPNSVLPHRRPVVWQPHVITREEMSEALQHSTGSAGTVSDISSHAEEVEALLSGRLSPGFLVTDETIEDPSLFAMEKHLEDFLVVNWKQTPLGQDYEIFIEDNETVGQQYPTDTGPIDILAVSKDKNTLLVVELKRGRASDVVVGQILRYMGYVKEEIAETDQAVKGVIIAMENDQRLQRALVMIPDIEFYQYEIRFKLKKI